MQLDPSLVSSAVEVAGLAGVALWLSRELVGSMRGQTEALGRSIDKLDNEVGKLGDKVDGLAIAVAHRVGADGGDLGDLSSNSPRRHSGG